MAKQRIKLKPTLISDVLIFALIANACGVGAGAPKMAFDMQTETVPWSNAYL